MQIDEIAATSYIAKKLFLKESPVHTWPIEELPDVPHVKGIDFYSKVMFTDEALRKNWYLVMWNEPWVYLKAKIELFKNFNSFPLKKKMVYYFWISKNKYGFKFNKEKITTVMFKHYLEIVNMLRFPFLPIFWIPLAAIIFFLQLKTRYIKKF